VKAVDLFAGAGGATAGIRQAGLEVVWAANHNRLAVELHARNNPGSLHACQDLHQARWEEVPEAEVVWASPACQGHSEAATRGLKGRRRGTHQKADTQRSTAWAVVSATEVLAPKVVVVENVTAFRSWKLYAAWLYAMKCLGFDCQEHVLDAVDFGVPQDRPRVFLIFTPEGCGWRLPKPPARDKVPASCAVQLDAGRWRRVEDCPAGVQRRVTRGRERFGPRPWLTQSVTGHPGRSLDRPMPCVTTQHQHGLVKTEGRATLYRPFTLSEYAAGMGWPTSYDWSGVGVSAGARLLGNAVSPPVAAWIATQLSRSFS
jgi:DNA (cytosine-5)-methyltransferase 1